MVHKALALAMTLGTAGLAHAQASYPNTDGFGRAADPTAPWYQECLRVAKVKPPPVPALPASCKVYDYYGKLAQATTSAAEWGGVRACAVADKNDAVLAMLYANGLGVPRNLDLATQSACRAGGAYAEVTGRIDHLIALQKSPPGTRYDQCDDITSGFMMGVCAGVADTQAEKVRIAYLARLRRQLPPPQVAPFDQLVAATDAFARARSGEIDLSGSGRAAFSLQAQAREKEWLREHLVAFEKGNVKLAPAQPLAAADAELNRTYQAVMRLPDTTVDKANVRATQRLWLAYRDAWLAFAALRYPAIPPATLNAALTEWRTKQLHAWAE